MSCLALAIPPKRTEPPAEAKKISTRPGRLLLMLPMAVAQKAGTKMEPW